MCNALTLINFIATLSAQSFFTRSPTPSLHTRVFPFYVFHFFLANWTLFCVILSLSKQEKHWSITKCRKKRSCARKANFSTHREKKHFLYETVYIFKKKFFFVENFGQKLIFGADKTDWVDQFFGIFMQNSPFK